MVLVPFLIKFGIVTLALIVAACIRDLAVDWIDVENLQIDANPNALQGNMNTWEIRVRFTLKDDSIFFGSIFGPRRIMSWRVVVEPDSNAVSNGWVQPQNFVKQGGRTYYAYFDETFRHTWDPPPGEHGSRVRIYIKNKEIVDQRFTFVRF